MIINHNLNAMNAQRNMSNLTIKQGKSMEKLNSGLRINKASDDAAGLAISEKMRSQIRGLNQASRNSQDGVSMIQTAEGAMSEIQEIGQRMRELAVQSANGTYTDEDRKLIDQEFGQLKKEIDRIANQTEFSGGKLLNGDKSGKTLKPNQRYIKNSPNGNGPNYDQTKLQNLLANALTEETAVKLGEGIFAVRITTGGGTKDNGVPKNSMKIDLIDESRFNGKKNYILDSVTVSTVNGKKDTKIKLADVEFNLDLSQANIVNGKEGMFAIENTVEKQEDGVKLQVGANEEQIVGFSMDFMRSRELGLGGLKIDTIENAREAIGRMDEAIKIVSSQRADLGAAQNRLEHTISSVDNTAENLQSAESRIRDVDMAKEMMNLTKLNVLQQASQAMLSQANQAPQQILSLLK